VLEDQYGCHENAGSCNVIKTLHNVVLLTILACCERLGVLTMALLGLTGYSELWFMQVSSMQLDAMKRGARAGFYLNIA
jgi:hypothetical protein